MLGVRRSGFFSARSGLEPASLDKTFTAALDAAPRVRGQRRHRCEES
jgi:hypothetical protein